MADLTQTARLLLEGGLGSRRFRWAQVNQRFLEGLLQTLEPIVDAKNFVKSRLISMYGDMLSFGMAPSELLAAET